MAAAEPGPVMSFARDLTRKAKSTRGPKAGRRVRRTLTLEPEDLEFLLKEMVDQAIKHGGRVSLDAHLSTIVREHCRRKRGGSAGG